MRGPLRAAALGLLALGCGEATGPEREISGKVLYDQYCARCHGADGKPVVPFASDLSDRQVVENLSDMAFQGIVRAGRPAARNEAGEIVNPGMPAFGEQFTDATLMVLIAYVRGFSGSQGSHAREEEPTAPEGPSDQAPPASGVAGEG